MSNPPLVPYDRSSAAEIDRRTFGRLAVAGLAGLAGLGAATPAGAPALPGARRRPQGGIFARPLGATGLWVSELTLGGSPSAPENVFLAAMDRGVNYCDTSPRYEKGNGERALGRIVRGRRNRICIGTKITPGRDGVHTTDDILKQVEGSLQRLGVEHIDVLCSHGVEREEQVLSPWIFEAIGRLRDAGKIRFFGASVHNTSPDFIRKMIETGQYHVLMLPLNMYFDPKSARPGMPGTDALAQNLRLAAEKGVGILTMKTLAAGGLANVAAPAGVSPAQAKLRWVLQRPEISGILNEMNTFEFLKDDLAASTADLALSAAESAWLAANADAGRHAVCRMCHTCEGGCPAALPIPDLLRVRMYAVDYGRRDKALELAGAIDAPGRLAQCRDCGRCEEACPWGVRTRRMLRDVGRVLG